jgi:serine protease Do
MYSKGLKTSLLTLVFGLVIPVSLPAQKEEKEVKDKKEVQQIIITRKGDKEEKMVVEVKGDKIIINGKTPEEFKEKDGDITITMKRLKDTDALFFERAPRGGTWNFNSDDKDFKFFGDMENRAMLGVTTQKVPEGAEVESVTKESAAEKAGLKENDIITKIDDKKITTPDDLSDAIKAHKPGDKVTITYQRENKEKKATAELTKWKGPRAVTIEKNLNLDLGDMDFEKIMPKIHEIPVPKAPFGQNWNWTSNNPKLGLSVQDTDDGKGVKVIEVDDESNADKAGIKEGDIITEMENKAINNTDDIVKMTKESKDKISVMIKLKREGKTMNIEVKMPRKLKTADL